VLYSLPLHGRAKSLPGAPNDVALRARDILVSWDKGVSDYAVRDYYELVQRYYRPRVRACIQAMRKSLDAGQRQLFPADALDKQYADIEDKCATEAFAC
jgi:hypothetical protein